MNVIAGCYGRIMFCIVRNCQSSKVTVPFCIPINKWVCYSLSSLAFAILSVLNFNHSNRCVWVSHYCSNLHFSGGTSFYMLIFHQYIFFCQVSIQVFCPFWGVIFPIIELLEFLIYLNSSHWSDISLANILFQSVSSTFIQQTVYFTTTGIFNCIEVQFINNFFHSLSLVLWLHIF